jgi:hypothetical protein
LTNSAILPIEVLLQGKAVVDHGSWERQVQPNTTSKICTSFHFHLQ